MSSQIVVCHAQQLWDFSGTPITNQPPLGHDQIRLDLWSSFSSLGRTQRCSPSHGGTIKCSFGSSTNGTPIVDQPPFNHDQIQPNLWSHFSTLKSTWGCSLSLRSTIEYSFGSLIESPIAEWSIDIRWST
ncbi:Uncharacterized protein TCM_000990 [Theobroma cacao]|uniref:Uncharacterized protein n=1 Tax=Theobroma cacao TaxID=3641 RepID=A0A061DHM4_THECC|nr:Uncharacterized protein TCM_000990 [Theobroma cacao]